MHVFLVFKIALCLTKSFLANPVSKHSTETDKGNRLLILFWKCLPCSFIREKTTWRIVIIPDNKKKFSRF